jgi:hypothetical protein
MYRNVIGRWLAAAMLCWCLPAGGPAQEPPAAGRPAEVQEQIRLMRYFDTDRDRRIDADEFSAGLETAALVLMMSWSDCDQSGDGWIDFEELGTAVAQARKTLAQAEAEAEEEEGDDERAAEALAGAVPLSVVLDRLAAEQAYADEIADLRASVEDLADEDVVVTYIVRNPARYPHLTPVVRTWGRYYPVKPAVRRHFENRPHRPPWYVKPPGAKKQTGKPGVKPGPKPKIGERPKHPPKPPPKPGP